MLLLDKLLLMRALREDRTPLGVKEYVMDALGKRYADSGEQVRHSHLHPVDGRGPDGCDQRAPRAR
jgi:hypothetical protein